MAVVRPSKFTKLYDAIATSRKGDYIYAQDCNGGGAKVFMAMPQETFVREYNKDLLYLHSANSVGQLNWYEVITGACKFYVDIDNIRNIDDIFEYLSWINTHFPQQQFRIFHRDNVSFHVIGSQVYESAQHIGDMLKSLNPPEKIDLSVYSSNRCWKIPFSRKFGKGSPMVPFEWSPEESIVAPCISPEDLVAAEPCGQPLLNSLRAYVSRGVRSQETERSVETERSAPTPAAPIKRSVLQRLVARCGEYYKVDKVNVADRSLVRLCLKSRSCSIAGRVHRHNHTFVLFDPDTEEFAMSCFNKECKKQKLRWTGL